MLNTLTNPIYWYGFATALVLMAVAVGFIAVGSRANAPRPRRSYRAADRAPWPGTSANDDASPHSRRSHMRGGPR